MSPSNQPMIANFDNLCLAFQQALDGEELLQMIGDFDALEIMYEDMPPLVSIHVISFQVPESYDVPEDVPEDIYEKIPNLISYENYDIQ